MVNKKTVKICVAASAGGHLSQLLKISGCWKDYDVFYVVTSKLVKNDIDKNNRIYVVVQCNRRNPLKLLKLLFCSFVIICRERPDVVISSGAAAGCVECFIGKMFGARIIWVDSITNVEKLSLSGRLVRSISDLFFVQWPQLTKKYTKVEFAGWLI